MKEYIIKTTHKIEVDEFDNGLAKHVNLYEFDIKEEIKADNPIQAIQKYFNNILFYDFDIKKAYIFHHEDEDEEKNTLEYDNLINGAGLEATEDERQLWRKGEKTLYNNNTFLRIYELNPATI